MAEAKNEKKFVRYEEGAKMYSMSKRKFEDIAKDAGAIHRVGRMVLVKVEKIDAYLETFKV